MDYSDRETKALEMLNAPEPAAESAATPATPPAAPAAEALTGGAGVGKLEGGAGVSAAAPGGPGAEGKAAEGGPGRAGPAVGAPPAVAPGVGQLGAGSVALWAGAPVALNDVQQVMGSHNIGNMEQLKGTLADAAALYDVLDGRQRASALLEAVRLNYSPQVFFRMLGEVRDYLQQFVPPPGMGGPAAGGPGGPGAGANGNGKGSDDGALVSRLSNLENNWALQQQQQQRAALEAQQRAGFDKFMGRIRELGQKEGLDEEDIGNYAQAVATRISGDPNITGRIVAGKLNDVDRLFTEHHNSMLQWENRRSQKRLQQKTEKSDAQPRIATGGGPPAPAKPAKQDMSFEGRTARAMEILKQ